MASATGLRRSDWLQYRRLRPCRSIVTGQLFLECGLRVGGVGMTKQRRIVLAAIAAACCFLVGEGRAADWPQLQNGPARLGYSPEKIDVPLKRAWVVGLSPERLFPQTQPVIAGGRVLLGTAMGNFHAFEATSGKKLWSFQAGGPILHTAGVEGGKVFFGCLDGSVYALDVERRQPGLEVR